MGAPRRCGKSWFSFGMGPSFHTQSCRGSCVFMNLLPSHFGALCCSLGTEMNAFSLGKTRIIGDGGVDFGSPKHTPTQPQILPELEKRYSRRRNSQTCRRWGARSSKLSTLGATILETFVSGSQHPREIHHWEPRSLRHSSLGATIFETPAIGRRDVRDIRH